MSQTDQMPQTRMLGNYPDQQLSYGLDAMDNGDGTYTIFRYSVDYSGDHPARTDHNHWTVSANDAYDLMTG